MASLNPAWHNLLPAGQCAPKRCERRRRHNGRMSVRILRHGGHQPVGQQPRHHILDLGFFASIQVLQDRTAPRIIDDLIQAVTDTWDQIEAVKLGKVWSTLQGHIALKISCWLGGQYLRRSPHAQGQGCEGGDTDPGNSGAPWRRTTPSRRRWWPWKLRLPLGARSRLGLKPGLCDVFEWYAVCWA